MKAILIGGPHDGEQRTVLRDAQQFVHYSADTRHVYTRYREPAFDLGEKGTRWSRHALFVHEGLVAAGEAEIERVIRDRGYKGGE